MKLKLSRIEQVDKATIGILFVDGKFQCFTLEDVVRDVKVPGETAIPAGEYSIEVTWSPKFNRNMPRLESVPGFDGVLIHYGNTDKDTDGCILVGDQHQSGVDFIGNSRKAFENLFEPMEDAFRNDNQISIEITNDFG